MYELLPVHRVVKPSVLRRSEGESLFGNDDNFIQWLDNLEDSLERRLAGANGEGDRAGEEDGADEDVSMLLEPLDMDGSSAADEDEEDDDEGSDTDDTDVDFDDLGLSTPDTSSDEEEIQEELLGLVGKNKKLLFFQLL